MATANVGPELEEVNTEVGGSSRRQQKMVRDRLCFHGITNCAKGLGFKTLHGEKKLKLLSAPWPADNLPPSSACLLSAASKRGLVAAAGPDQLVVATADSIRAAFEKDADESTNVVTDFSPAVTIPVPKLRHVAFSSDEDFLVISAEEGGGLAIYDAAGLLENKLSSTQFPTDQTPVRALVPNPNPQYGHFFAAVLDSGRLLLIDVTQKKSTVIHEIDVTCVAWSIKGLALVAGLKDGSAVQYKTDGKLLATVPAPPEMDPDFIGEYSNAAV
jgi:nucleoporin NUP159